MTMSCENSVTYLALFEVAAGKTCWKSWEIRAQQVREVEVAL